MKKLLILLAAIGLTSTAAISVVSCGSETHKDNKQDIKKVFTSNTLDSVSYDSISSIKRSIERQFNFNDWNSITIKQKDGQVDISTENSDIYKGDITLSYSTTKGKEIDKKAKNVKASHLFENMSTLYLTTDENGNIDQYQTIWYSLCGNTNTPMDWEFKDSIEITGLDEAYQSFEKTETNFSSTKQGAQKVNDINLFKDVTIQVKKNLKIKNTNETYYVNASSKLIANVGQITQVVNGTSAKSFNSINQEVDRLISEQYLGQADLLIQKDGKDIYRYQTGLADQTKTDSTINDNSLYRVMSMTKPLTSVAFLHLIDLLKENNITWTSDFDSSKTIDFANSDFTQMNLKDFFKSWDKTNLHVANSNDAVKSDITIEQMLTMTSGIDYFTTDMLSIVAQWKIGGWSMDQLADSVAGAALKSQPGETWNYGLNMDLIGCVGNKILETLKDKIPGISSTTWEDYIQNSFLTPLGMNDSYYGKAIPEDKLSNLVVPGTTDYKTGKYRNDEDNMLLDLGWQNALDKDQPCPMGGNTLITTANDYAKLQRMLLSGTTDDGTQLVSKQTIDNMHVNHLSSDVMNKVRTGALLPEGFGYGYGVDVKVDEPTFSNSVSTTSFGWDGMFSSLSIMDPTSNVNIVFMANVTDENTVIIQQIYNVIYNNLRELGYIK